MKIEQEKKETRGWVAITPDGWADWETLAIEPWGEGGATAEGKIFGTSLEARTEALAAGWKIAEVLLIAK